MRVDLCLDDGTNSLPDKFDIIILVNCKITSEPLKNIDHSLK